MKLASALRFPAVWALLGAAQSTLIVDVSMVEVYVRVEDRGGTPVTDLALEDFVVFEDTRPQRIELFEPETAAMTIALLVDTTGSMTADLPYVKNAVFRLLSALKPEDSVGLFSFAQQLTTLDDFTTDRNSTLDSLLGVRPAGRTALFDSLVQLSRRLSQVGGKKAVLLFTDGDDNMSTLSLASALQGVQRYGVPVYAMIHGRALDDRNLTRQLEGISEATGGLAFRLRNASDLPEVFERIGQDLQHLYLIGYQSDNPGTTSWREISVRLLDHPEFRLRAKEGYSP